MANLTEEETLADSLCCEADIVYLQSYFAGVSPAQLSQEGINGNVNQNVQIIQNLSQNKFTPLDESINGYMLVKKDDTLDQINNYSIKHITYYNDNPDDYLIDMKEYANMAGSHMKSIQVLVETGVKCYIFDEDEYIANLFTKDQITKDGDKFVIKPQ